MDRTASAISQLDRFETFEAEAVTVEHIAKANYLALFQKDVGSKTTRVVSNSEGEYRVTVERVG